MQNVDGRSTYTYPTVRSFAYRPGWQSRRQSRCLKDGTSPGTRAADPGHTCWVRLTELFSPTWPGGALKGINMLPCHQQHWTIVIVGFRTCCNVQVQEREADAFQGGWETQWYPVVAKTSISGSTQRIDHAWLRESLLRSCERHRDDNIQR
jgi:hypothetical protein